jgi:putative peptidoglycan lipid II flippase
LATLVSTSAPTLLTFAQHLQVVPIGLFGATMAQAALPVLSASKSKGELEQFKATFLTTFHQILFLTLPSAAILIVLRIPVVRLTFGASQFNWTDTVLTAQTLAYFAGGIAAQSSALLLIRGFYALRDTKTPVMVSLISVAVNIFLSILFVSWLHMEVWSLGLSYSIASNISLMLLLYFLHQRVGGFDLEKLVTPGLKMVFSATVAAFALYLPLKGLDQLIFDTTKTANLLVLTGIASAFGLSIYGLLVWLLKVEELYIFGNLLKRVWKKLYNFQFIIKSEEMVGETGPGSV